MPSESETHHESPQLPRRHGGHGRPRVDNPGSGPPRRSAQVIVPSMSPAELDDLKSVAPDIGLVFCPGEAEAVEQAAGAVACYGFITHDVIRAGKSLRWVQQPSVGVEGLMGDRGVAGLEIGKGLWRYRPPRGPSGHPAPSGPNSDVSPRTTRSLIV